MMAATVAMEGARIVIAGAGLQGAALAYYLTLRGAKPIVVRPITWSDASSVRCCEGEPRRQQQRSNSWRRMWPSLWTLTQRSCRCSGAI